MTSVVNQQILPQPHTEPSKNWTDTGPSSGRSQRLMRYTGTLWDQHKHQNVRNGLFANGRPWWGEFHRAANRDELTLGGGRPIPDPVFGPLTPGDHVRTEQGTVDRNACLNSVWEAPWYPLPKYFKFDYDRKRISFDYTRMRMEELAGLRDYWRAASKLGAQINIRVEQGAMPHSQIVDVLGEPSQMYRVAEAAMAGDPWILGFSPEPNPQLAKILGYTHSADDRWNFNERHTDTPPAANHVQGLRTNETSPPSAIGQQAAVEAINTAPPNMDLLEMIAGLIDRKFAERDAATASKKAEDKARMDRIRPQGKKTPQAKRADNVQVGG